jgi:hypothetical protein
LDLQLEYPPTNNWRREGGRGTERGGWKSENVERKENGGGELIAKIERGRERTCDKNDLREGSGREEERETERVQDEQAERRRDVSGNTY